MRPVPQSEEPVWTDGSSFALAGTLDMDAAMTGSALIRSSTASTATTQSTHARHRTVREPGYQPARVSCAPRRGVHAPLRVDDLIRAYGTVG
jgi:hypothetical protein